MSARADYALRALVVLAARGEPTTAEALARDQQLPRKYLEAILLDLRRSGIITTKRGPDAGYRFLRDPSGLTPADVMRALEGPLAEVRGLRPESTSYSGAATSLQDLWIALRANLRAVLEGVTIADLAAGKFPRRLAGLIADPAAWAPRTS